MTPFHPKRGIGGETIAVRRLVSVASAVILVAIIGFCLSNDGQAKAGSDAMVHPPAQSPSTIRAAETLTPTYEAHLPFVCRNFPPVIQVPEGEYLLVEHWTLSVLGTNCEGLCIDFPTYSFDSKRCAHY